LELEWDFVNDLYGHPKRIVIDDTYFDGVFVPVGEFIRDETLTENTFFS
jgi:hypothetical protein